MTDNDYFDPKETSENISKMMGNYKNKLFPKKKKRNPWATTNFNPKT